MKRPAHLTLVDADRYSALVSRCTEQRERAEKAEAHIEALEKLLAKDRGCGECWHGVSCGADCHMNDVAALAKEEKIP